MAAVARCITPFSGPSHLSRSVAVGRGRCLRGLTYAAGHSLLHFSHPRCGGNTLTKGIESSLIIENLQEIFANDPFGDYIHGETDNLVASSDGWNLVIWISLRPTKGHSLPLELAVGFDNNVCRRIVTLLVPWPSTHSAKQVDLHGVGTIPGDIGWITNI